MAKTPLYMKGHVKKATQQTTDAGRFEEGKHPRANNGQFGAGEGKSHTEHAAHHGDESDQHHDLSLELKARGRHTLSSLHKDAAIEHAYAAAYHRAAHRSGRTAGPDAEKAHSASQTAHAASQTAAANKRHDYIVKARHSETGKLHTHLVKGVPGDGGEHRAAGEHVESKTGHKWVSSVRADSGEAEDPKSTFRLKEGHPVHDYSSHGMAHAASKSAHEASQKAANEAGLGESQRAHGLHESASHAIAEKHGWGDTDPSDGSTSYMGHKQNNERYLEVNHKTGEWSHGVANTGGERELGRGHGAETLKKHLGDYDAGRLPEQRNSK